MIRRLTHFVPGWLLALSGCSVAVLGAMGWITHRALTLEIAEAKARAAATRQEAVRLALWRMDSWMTSLIAREAARPYFHYVSFYPTDRPYALYSSDFTIDALTASETVSPSPLLTSPPPDVKLYFQIWPDGHITSPQVPTGGLRGLALLADANGNSIDAASGTLNELTTLLASGDSRRALGAGEQPLAGAITLSDFAAPTPAPTATGNPQVGGTAAPDQTKLEGGPGGTGNPPTQIANRGTNAVDQRPTQQQELDGKQRWQTSNDYEVRQQVAETTRNISQNRAPAYQTATPGNPQQVQTAGNNDPANAADPKVLAEAALRKSAGESGSKQSDNKASDAAKANATKDTLSEVVTSTSGTAERAETGTSSPADSALAAKKESTPANPAAATPRPPGGKSPPTQVAEEVRKDKTRALSKEDQVRLAASSTPKEEPKPETKAGAKGSENLAEDRSASPLTTASTATIATGSGTGSDRARADATLKESTPARPTADLAIPSSTPGSSSTTPPALDKLIEDASRGYGRDSFPVVVRSLDIEPTPLITACVASPVELLPTPYTPLNSVPPTIADPSAAASGNTHSPTLAPPRDTASPIVHASVPFNLFLTRQVPLDSGRVVQGMWLDWPMLRTNLLALSQDLLPGATLELCAPMSPNAAAGDAGLMLASIPARLILPADPAVNISMLSLLTGDTWSPTRIAIIGGWIAVLGGVFAIGWVLRQSVQLGERRGRFVSAVTHELRTPLTTFALYSQMLADGMVQDPEAQREYHQTLRKESDRLSRIVESVLDYARLGKRRSDTNGNVIRPAINAADLIKAVEPHLRSRASVSGLELIVDTPDLSTITLRAERDSVERILENLVENAGKYAAGHGTDQRLHLIAALEGRWLNLDIADHGPGIAPGEARRIFAPFERGKAQQDGSKPGLGLGLAFARGLARDLGGDLILLSPQDSMRAGFGAIFRLRIPAELEVQNAETAADSAAIADPSENSPVDAAPPTESRPQ